MEEHGFLSREGWMGALNSYNSLISSLNEACFALVSDPLGPDAWVEKYRAHSGSVRETYAQVEELLDRNIRYFTEESGRWTRAVADPLLSCLFRSVMNLEDTASVDVLADSLSAFYAGLGDEIALMKCGAVKMIACFLLDDVSLAPEIWALYLRVQAVYERRFLDLTPEERSMGLSVYDTFFALLSDILLRGYQAQALDAAFRCYPAARRAEMYVRAEDRGYEFNRVIPAMDERFLACLTNVDGVRFTAPRQGALQRAVEGFRARDGAGGALQRAHERAVCDLVQNRLGRLGDAPLLQSVGACLDAVKREAVAGEYSYFVSQAALFVVVAARRLARANAHAQALYQDALCFFLDYFTALPLSTFSSSLSGQNLFNYLCDDLRHLRRRDHLEALLKLTVFRQPQTATHTLMVARLARAIVRAVVRGKPELLIGQLGTQSAREVRAREAELLDWIHKAALLHDVGKILCANVVNTQYRRITDLEFRVIQYHPEAGGRILDGIPELRGFADIARGHHRFYDGSAGYPASFDIAASPLRPMIGVIALCDSLDAATDTLGRNYARGKRFDAVLSELHAQRGGRYSAELVDLLQGDALLQTQVRALVTEGRSEVYREVHELIQKETERLA